MRSMDAEATTMLERPTATAESLRWDRIREARAKIRRGDYDFDAEGQPRGLPAGVCLVSMLRDVLNVA